MTGAGALPGEQDTLPIVQCGDPVLRRAADPVEPSGLRTPELQTLIAQMRTTMETAPGVGLAAPQVGVSLQLAVLQDGPQQWAHLSDDERADREREHLPFTVLVNPTVQPVADDDRISFYEGCLSVPGLTGVVARHRAVRVEAWIKTANQSSGCSPGGRRASSNTKSTTCAAASTWTTSRPGPSPPSTSTQADGPGARLATQPLPLASHWTSQGRENRNSGSRRECLLGSPGRPAQNGRSPFSVTRWIKRCWSP